MNFKRRFLMLLIFVAFVSVSVFAGSRMVSTGEVDYEQVPSDQVPEQVKRHLTDSQPGTGIAEVGGNTYAFVIGAAGEEIEILSVEKADVGLDVIYRVKKSSDLNSPARTKVVRFGNLFGSPIGFKKQTDTPPYQTVQKYTELKIELGPGNNPTPVQLGGTIDFSLDHGSIPMFITPDRPFGEVRLSVTPEGWHLERKNPPGGTTWYYNIRVEPSAPSEGEVSIEKAFDLEGKPIISEPVSFRIKLKDPMQGKYLDEASALKIAKARDVNGNAKWSAEYREDSEVEMHGGKKEKRPAWIVQGVYPLGNKVSIQIDAVTGEILSEWQIENRH